MRIVAHNGAKIWGGAERATVRLLAGLAARGHEVRLLCNSPLVLGEAMNQGVPAELRPIGGDSAIHHAFRLASRLREIRPDAFIVGTFRKIFLTALGARMAGIPNIVARVGLESDTPKSWKYRFALRRWTDKVVVNSSSMVESFASLEGFGPTRVTIIHNGVIAPKTSSDPGGLRADLGIPTSAFLVGTVARLAEQKRIDRLVDVFSALPAGVHCVVAGEGDRRAEIEGAIRHRGVEGRFHLLGNRDDVAQVLHALDLYVLCSDREGLSNGMLEAMSLGRPVVTTDVSGARDAIGPRSGMTAGIITDFSPLAIAAGIRTLMDDPEMRAACGREAAVRAAADFSVERMLDKWEAFLSQPAR